ncbi:MAG: M6 family metalloprotease domain-containing protein [Paludibacteraceae bacterium]|nr:M6 family metalloprotease domain-containing protein [Paludibacteraceae bacterium]
MKRIIFSLLVLCAISLSLSAKPARRGAMTVTQPDGTQITAFLHGNADYHYYTTVDGKMLERDADGFYCAIAMPSDEELQARRNSSPRRVVREQKGSTLNLAPRGLIILVNFSNLSFKTQIAEMDSMINGLNYSRSYSVRDGSGRSVKVTSTGSARQYFHDTSCGQYNPVFDVVGPVTLSQKYSYYGGNNSNDEDKNPEQMIKEACELVDDEVDFSIYDNNGDGYVDFVYVIYAGYGEADGAGEDYVWPHNYWLSASHVSCTVDKKTVDNYACSNEIDYYSRQHDGIGTFCHEFSHVLGLPDLYSTNNATHKTMGAWDILDYGPYNNEGNTPPHYSAYERFFMGWLKPVVVNQACNIELPALNDVNTAALLTATGKHNLVGTDPNPTTFYMLENRQKKGWDAHLPGHGLLVTKITYSQNKWDGNTVNNTKAAMGVDIMEADGSAPAYNEDDYDNGYFGKQGDAYPAGSTSFTKLVEYQVTDIAENGGLISFKVNGGGETILLDVDDIRQPAAPASRKVMRDGKILIEHNGMYYDLLGNPCR